MTDKPKDSFTEPQTLQETSLSNNISNKIQFNGLTDNNIAEPPNVIFSSASSEPTNILQSENSTSVILNENSNSVSTILNLPVNLISTLAIENSQSYSTVQNQSDSLLFSSPSSNRIAPSIFGSISSPSVDHPNGNLLSWNTNSNPFLTPTKSSGLALLNSELIASPMMEDSSDGFGSNYRRDEADCKNFYKHFDTVWIELCHFWRFELDYFRWNFNFFLWKWYSWKT